MEVTNIQFSVAKRNTEIGDDAAFFSVELNNCLVIHRFTLLRTKEGYKMHLPTQKTNSITKADLRPFIYIKDSSFYKTIEREVLKKFYKLLDEYNNLYIRREHGPHS